MMTEELGKIEKPLVEDYKGGRKLFFIPLLFPGKDLPQEFQEKSSRYWKQAESQIANLEDKLGPVNHIFHELVHESGEAGILAINQLGVNSLKIVRSRVEKGAVLEAMESSEILTELTDLSRCLALGLQSQRVFSALYELYNEVNKKRNEHIAGVIKDKLKENETGIFIMAEGHNIQFPDDIKVFYIAPPALDEIKRWWRDYETKLKEQQDQEHDSSAEKPDSPTNP